MNSIRAKLFFWFVGSQLLLILYFLLFIHFHTITYAFQILVILFIVQSVIGFVIIHRIVKSLTYLSSKMKLISRKNLDERIKNIEREDEIGELAVTFNSLLDRLSEAFKREQQFIADVAHELKTPLSIIKGSFEVVLNKKREEGEYEQTIKNSISEINRMSLTLNNVLDLAWSETRSEQNKPVKVNLTEVMEEMCDIAEKMAMQKRITIQTDIGKNIFVLGFKDKLGKAMLNIIENAVKYNREGGRINLTLQAGDKMAQVIVEDTGKGITADDIPHIFDRFYRGGAGDKILGNGLGLAIAKSIVNLHGGEIKVESKVNQGTTFTVSFPQSTTS